MYNLSGRSIFFQEFDISVLHGLVLLRRHRAEVQAILKSQVRFIKAQGTLKTWESKTKAKVPGSLGFRPSMMLASHVWTKPSDDPIWRVKHGAVRAMRSHVDLG